MSFSWKLIYTFKESLKGRYGSVYSFDQHLQKNIEKQNSEVPDDED